MNRDKKSYNLEHLNFLVVDDNKHMRALVRSILNALGSKHCWEASDGADAFKALKHYPADIVICDWTMAPLDGLEFVKAVRTAEGSPNPYVPIIMLTGHTDMTRVMVARDTGVNEFLAKPISAASLYARIKSIIEKPRKFVKTDKYFGPDRRRQTLEWKSEERRSSAPSAAEEAPEPAPPAGESAPESEEPAEAGGMAAEQTE